MLSLLATLCAALVLSTSTASSSSPNRPNLESLFGVDVTRGKSEQNKMHGQPKRRQRRVVNVSPSKATSPRLSRHHGHVRNRDASPLTAIPSPNTEEPKNHFMHNRSPNSRQSRHVRIIRGSPQRTAKQSPESSPKSRRASAVTFLSLPTVKGSSDALRTFTTESSKSGQKTQDLRLVVTPWSDVRECVASEISLRTENVSSSAGETDRKGKEYVITTPLAAPLLVQFDGKMPKLDDTGHHQQVVIAEAAFCTLSRKTVFMGVGVLWLIMVGIIIWRTSGVE